MILDPSSIGSRTLVPTVIATLASKKNKKNKRKKKNSKRSKNRKIGESDSSRLP